MYWSGIDEFPFLVFLVFDCAKQSMRTGVVTWLPADSKRLWPCRVINSEDNRINTTFKPQLISLCLWTWESVLICMIVRASLFISKINLILATQTNPSFIVSHLGCWMSWGETPLILYSQEKGVSGSLP